MKNRYKLPVDVQRDYLIELEKVSGLNGGNLAKVLGIVGRSYLDWRRGKYPITQEAVEIIEKKYQLGLAFSKEEALNLWKKSKLEASRRGGLAVSAKYGGPGTPEGRSKGGKHTMALLRARGVVSRTKSFNVPKKYSQELAEFVGIMLGDGHLGRDQWSITLNSIRDAEYAKHVINLIEILFGFRPTFRVRTDENVIIIYGYGVRLIQYLQKLGLFIGNKVKQQVGVPDWIVSGENFRRSCLRGLMDTDGGIFVHSYKVNGKEYKYRKLCFANRSVPLLNFVYDSLKSLDLNPKALLDVETKRVWLYNQREVEGYLNTVGTSNLRLIKAFGGLPER